MDTHETLAAGSTNIYLSVWRNIVSVLESVNRIAKCVSVKTLSLIIIEVVSEQCH